MKITYVISNINKAFEFEWASTELTKRGYKLSFILLNKEKSELETFLNNNSIPCITINYESKYDLPQVIYKLIKIFNEQKPDIVHCHLFEATIAGLLAAKLSGIKYKVHTRHHSTWHHKYHKNAVKYDRLNNTLSTKIIAVSNIVKKVLIQENVPNNKIEVIFHGIDLMEFLNIDDSRISKLKQIYNNKSKFPVIGVISRYTEWKGIQYIIPAFKKLLKDYPDALLILANAQGNFKPTIQHMLASLPATSYKEITFENDLFALYRLFSIFVHVPVDMDSEAFGQVYIEAMASRIPLICTKSGIGAEILEHEKNALIVPYRESEPIYNNLNKLLHDSKWGNILTENGFETVQNFTLEQKIDKLNNLYHRLHDGR